MNKTSLPECSCTSFILPLVLCAGIGGVAQAQAINEAVVTGLSKYSLGSLSAGVARGDPEAMYWLAMLHVEGTIDKADYDYGIRLLKKSASKGYADAQRMYAFMDNAFSGEGC